MQLIVFREVVKHRHDLCFSCCAPPDLVAPLWIGIHSSKHQVLLSAANFLYCFCSLIKTSWYCTVLYMYYRRPLYSKIRRIQSAVEEHGYLQWKLNASTSAAAISNSPMLCCSAVCLSWLSICSVFLCLMFFQFIFRPPWCMYHWKHHTHSLLPGMYMATIPTCLFQ